ncbi:Zinc finger and SCAN domain-containing protein 20 [Chelonia mydas]|uniref:Zinc finger and SCAN domain-containing protein 20 n=1 Tax=Chelonia mydas TaxID=8469 RepID=M7BH34_CHEMY|nr:Zinc finger and SCAN domain-containing protein 20 [Chelonia mydas]
MEAGKITVRINSILTKPVVTVAGYCIKRSPAWTTAELLDLISIWGKESVQSQLHLTHRNWDIYGHISQGLSEKDYDWDTLQCRSKIKELRQVYHKAREANRHSSAAPKTCHFYKELDSILDGDPTSKSPVDTSERMEEAEGVPNREDEVIDEEMELDLDVALPVESTGGAGSQELFSTPEVPSQSQQLLSGKQEADEMPGK